MEFKILRYNDIDSLLIFLRKIDREFATPLSQKTNLFDYCEKLLTKGIVIAVLEANEIVSCRAFYCNDANNGIAYGSMMGTLPKAQGKGFARFLIKEMMRICKQNGARCIISSSVNPKAISLYKSIGYKVIQEDIIGNVKKETLQLDL